MTINSYLTNLAEQAILRDAEKASVQRSVATLQTRLNEHFGTTVSDHVIFGSFSRGTILPRSMDAHSDVDYMVVFSDAGLQPQSYLDRLRRFAEASYSRSEVAQAHPTVALDLNHIRFELVPAVRDWWNGLQIPGKGQGYQSWQQTDPNGFNSTLSAVNQANANLVKPLVRVMKYWNAAANYPFESYELEQKIAGHSFGFLNFFSSPQLGRYFTSFVEELDVGWSAPQWKKEAVARLKDLVRQASALEQAGQSAQADAIIAKLLPPVGGLLGR